MAASAFKRRVADLVHQTKVHLERKTSVVVVALFYSLRCLQASVYQMVVLDLFNEHSILTVEQIGDRTRLKIETLRQTVASLIRTQLLLSPDIKPDKLASLKDEEIQFELAVTFNPTFKR